MKNSLLFITEWLVINNYKFKALDNYLIKRIYFKNVMDNIKKHIFFIIKKYFKRIRDGSCPLKVSLAKIYLNMVSIYIILTYLFYVLVRT